MLAKLLYALKSLSRFQTNNLGPWYCLKYNTSLSHDYLKQSDDHDYHAIAPVQKTRGDHNTFVEVSSSIFKGILHECSDSIRIDVIFNVYREETIKDIERAVRDQDIVPGHKVQLWRRLLSNSHNKQSLIEFITKECNLGYRHFFCHIVVTSQL